MIVVERVGFMRTVQFTELVAKEILLDCSHRTRKIYKGIKSRNPKSGGHWQETGFEESTDDVLEPDFEPARWSSYLAKRISALTLMTNLLSCGFGSHMNNPAGRCNRASNAEERSE